MAPNASEGLACRPVLSRSGLGQDVSLATHGTKPLRTRGCINRVSRGAREGMTPHVLVGRARRPRADRACHRLMSMQRNLARSPRKWFDRPRTDKLGRTICIAWEPSLGPWRRAQEPPPLITQRARGHPPDTKRTPALRPRWRRNLHASNKLQESNNCPMLDLAALSRD